MVDVQGIDNHQLTNIPIVTAYGVVKAQHDQEIILVMNQYAHIKQGPTIHSAAQLEAHGNIVDDRSKVVKGNQILITHGGYVVPINICNALPYIDMRPPTDAEMDPNNGLPQVILTSDLDWTPKSMD